MNFLYRCESFLNNRMSSHSAHIPYKALLMFFYKINYF